MSRFKEAIPTEDGTFILEFSQKGLYALKFPPQKKEAKAAPAGPRKKYSALKRTELLLKGYLSGWPVRFSNLKIDFSGFTKLERQVLRVLARVPAGSVTSYGELAKKIGRPRAARFVGSVMRKNRLPILLPCHRVLAADGCLGGYSQGLAWKRKLLKLEGVL